MTLATAITRRLGDLARGASPLLIASDLDGVLAPIVPLPEDALVPASTVATLGRLTALAHVAIVTGRDLATARALVPAPALEFVASHGHEASFTASALPPPDPTLAERLEQLTRTVEARFQGTALRVERKARSTAFHYRADPSLGEPLRAALDGLPAGLRLQAGRRVLEVLPAGAGKGGAVAALVERFAPRSLLALGDDLTDVAMFEAAGAFRAEGATVLLLAVEGGAETPPEVVAAADALVAQGEVGELLALLGDELSGASPA